jgi:hypothetical protein
VSAYKHLSGFGRVVDLDRPVAGGVLIGTDCAREEGAQRLRSAKGSRLSVKAPFSG